MNTNTKRTMDEVKNLQESICKQLAIFTQTLSGADRESVMITAEDALAAAMEGRLTEANLTLLEYAVVSDEEWDNIISLIQKINALAKDAKPVKRPGFASLAENIKAEVSEAEAKREADRRFISSLIKDAAGTYGISVDNQVSQGLSANDFTRKSHDSRAEIVGIIRPRLDDSDALREHARLMNTAVKAADNNYRSLEYDWDNYLMEFFPEVMQRLEGSECQFKPECKRSLTYIALQIELESLKEIFNIPPKVARDDDLY